MIALAGSAGSTPVTGTLVVLVLIAASIGLFFALSRSLRTMGRRFAPPPADPDPERPGEQGDPPG